MKLDGFSYKVKVEVLFSLEELNVLMKMSSQHYDRVCNSLSEQSGIIHTMLKIQSLDKSIGIETTPWALSFRDLDLMCKIMEPAPCEGLNNTYELIQNLHALIQDLHTEQQRLNDVADSAQSEEGS